MAIGFLLSLLSFMRTFLAVAVGWLHRPQAQKIALRNQIGPLWRPEPIGCHTSAGQRLICSNLPKRQLCGFLDIAERPCATHHGCTCRPWEELEDIVRYSHLSEDLDCLEPPVHGRRTSTESRLRRSCEDNNSFEAKKYRRALALAPAALTSNPWTGCFLVDMEVPGSHLQAGPAEPSSTRSLTPRSSMRGPGSLSCHRLGILKLVNMFTSQAFGFLHLAAESAKGGQSHGNLSSPTLTSTAEVGIPLPLHSLQTLQR
ncbi:unnamed protein product [Cladocopium goreaui]|uniref:Uncharacterized protein n=1 Tax=Cladocopium goreaui TaxID=2562237 RepID=A0A9P1FUU7_9DINO|nr:unnamed protein product [Cladocopium goreaui]